MYVYVRVYICISVRSTTFLCMCVRILMEKSAKAGVCVYIPIYGNVVDLR